MARHASLADRYRAHRLAFELALELGCTPKEAELELRRREACARDRDACARLTVKLNAEPGQSDGIPADAPWMMRD